MYPTLEDNEKVVAVIVENSYFEKQTKNISFKVHVIDKNSGT